MRCSGCCSSSNLRLDSLQHKEVHPKQHRPQRQAVQVRRKQRRQCQVHQLPFRCWHSSFKS